MSRRNEAAVNYVQLALAQMLTGYELKSHETCADENPYRLCGNPEQYSWQHVGCKNLLIPYDSQSCPPGATRHPDSLDFIDTVRIRWEVQCVHIIQGIIRHDVRNAVARRVFYMDEKSCQIILGDEYNIHGELINCYICFGQTKQDHRGRWYPLHRVMAS